LKEVISHETLKSLLECNVYTGQFVWKQPAGRATKGTVAGTWKPWMVNGKPTAYSIKINKRLYPAAKLVWFYFYGTYPDKTTRIGFHDGDPANLRLANLYEELNFRNKPRK
jgi:hypothetical protein